MSAPRVVVSGVGFVTSIGNDAATVASSLRELRSGIERCDLLPGTELPIKVAGTLKGFETSSPTWAGWRWPEGYSFNREILRGMAPHGLFGLCAAEQVIRDAKLTAAELRTDETALFCASAGSPRLLRGLLNQIYDSRGERIPPMGVVSTVAGTLNFNLAAFYGIRGAVTGFVSACTSSTHAIGYGYDEIALGRHRRVLVVGAEDLSFDSIFPFHGMRALSRNTDPATASRPFDRRRDGFVGTGGAAALLLEASDAAEQRGAPIYAEIIGWGQSGDGYNVAQSAPDGGGLATAIRRALRHAAIAPTAVDYVNAHATSTPAGDLSEARALRTVFGVAGAKPAVSSTKALTGHGLSFCGVMETGFCALALDQGFVPGAANLEEPDPECAGLDLPRTTRATSPQVVLKNSSGFGGSNVSVILRRWQKPACSTSQA